MQMDITIEMNLDLIVIFRQGYTILDLLSDIGRAQSILVSAISFWIGAWNYRMVDNYIADKLFRVVEHKNMIPVKLAKTSCYYNFIEYIKDCLPQKLICCKRNMGQINLDRARQKLEKDLNIVEIVQQRRYFVQAFKVLLSKSLRKQLIAKGCFLKLDEHDNDIESDFEADRDENDLGLERTTGATLNQLINTTTPGVHSWVNRLSADSIATMQR